MKKLPPGTLSGSQSALLRFVPSFFIEASVPHLPVDRSLRAPGQFRQLAGSNLQRLLPVPLCPWLLRPLQSLSRLVSYTRFMVITTTESLYRPFRRRRSPKKTCTSITSTLPLPVLFLSPLYYLDSFCGTLKKPLVGFPSHPQTFLFFFSSFSH